MKKKPSEKERIQKLLRDNAIVKLDLGCGENKQPGFVGVDFRKVKGVDIVQNLTMFPWHNIPDACADVAYASHFLEHINPASSDPRLAGLLNLLLDKKIVAKKDIEAYVGDYEFLGGFIRFMDEVWRILKPGGQLIATFPYGGSTGYWQDPTHVNPITHITLTYFDPLAKDSNGNLYRLFSIYRPKPWKILRCFYDHNGFVEIALEKRLIDKTYRVSKEGGLEA